MIQVLPFSSMDPVPRATVEVSGLPVGAVTLNVWCESTSGVRRVRKGAEASVTDPFKVTDYAVPFNEDVTYWAEYFDATGAKLGESERGTTRVVFDGTVLHQPLDPSRAVWVLDLSETARTVKRSVLGDHVRPGGGMPIWIGKGGREVSTRLRMALMDDRDLAAAQSMFGTAAEPLPPIICLRTSLPLHLPYPFFFLAQDTGWDAWDRYAGGDTTVLEWDVVETSEPALGLLISPLTYSDFEAFYATYSAFETDPLNVTYSAAEGRTDLAGVA